MTRARLADQPTPDLDVPSIYRTNLLRADADAFGEACRHAGANAAEAGDLFIVRRADLCEFAVVLAPEEPLATARRALFAGLNALADALAVAAPPEKPILFEWPATIRIDGARVGGARLGWPKQATDDAVPDWLVFSAQVWIDKSAAGEPGLTPGSTDLIEEGFEEPSADRLIESFSRHLMTGFDQWHARGFKAVAETYLARLTKADKAERRGIDGNGDLLIHGTRPGGADRRSLLEGLAALDWFDRATGMPRL
jgi:Biotin/lipoate A/B protein ligase family